MTIKAVLAGFSPIIDSLATITWAADYAGRLHAPLRVVLADGGSLPALYNATATVRTRYPQLSLSAMTANDSLVDALLDRATDAHLIVVDRAAAKAGMAATVAAQASCPVATVAPGTAWDGENRPILVGADGTEHSEQALRWAFTEADRLGRGVRVVHCQPHRTSTEQRNSVFDLVSLFAGRYPAMAMQLHTLVCAPADALAWHSQFAAMVLIGHHEHGIGGRIYRRVLREAACPVVIAGPDTILDAAIAAPALDTVRS
ncbi:universal stress protein [Kutzneria kofuensis]|uniref:Nucleotide-binding universal stress UspA family protein n=1 Tax=Kutzneria kofuensis TaxID=103725 RepID=A0A7W9KST7_9PSEU|nr:universal stress protein [Kutzneria kofuensis]MBB5898082.1 nucleotide-binding universal stress UspA family protein [Kutzneria kofuensis]